MDTRAHWEHVYTAKGEKDVSWFETLPSASIARGLEIRSPTHTRLSPKRLKVNRPCT